VAARFERAKADPRVCRFRFRTFDALLRDSGSRAGSVSMEPGQKTTTRGATTMRFMMIVKASKDSEAGVLPTEQELADMAKYNEELAKSGAMLAGEGLQASSKGARVRYSGKKRDVIDGPFAETKELIAGFWLIQARSKEEAIEWAKRVPFDDGEVEIRQVFELEDFGEGEAIDRHKRLREETANR
jgi:hypothetical protein